MYIYLMFSPTRTREYTRTPFDFDHDFFVGFTDFEAACATLEATGPVGQRLIEELKDECGNLWTDPPYALTNDWNTWKQYMPYAWNEAIGMSVVELVGELTDDIDTVYVVLEQRTREIWGRGATYNYWQGLKAFISRDVAEIWAKPRPQQTVVVKQRLLGLPVRT